MTTAEERAQLLKYATRVKSSAASMLSNASLLYKAAEALTVEQPPAAAAGLPAGLTVADLDPWTGDRTTLSSGTYRRKNFLGHVTIPTGADVVLEDCVATGPTATGYLGPALIDVQPGATLTLRRFEIRPALSKWWLVGIRTAGTLNADLLRIRETVDGIQVTGGVTTLTDPDIGELAFFSDSGDQAKDAYHPGWTHNDAVQVRAGALTVKGGILSGRVSENVGHPDVLRSGGFADLMRAVPVTVSVDKGPCTGLLLEDVNMLGGEAGFQMNLPNTGGPSHVGTIRRCRFDREQHDFGGGSRYAIRHHRDVTLTLEGNVYPDGSPVVARVNA